LIRVHLWPNLFVVHTRKPKVRILAADEHVTRIRKTLTELDLNLAIVVFPRQRGGPSVSVRQVPDRMESFLRAQPNKCLGWGKLSAKGT
jgi:hypothetical protein